MITAERWQRIKEVFNSALECEPGQRPAFLSRACAADDALRSEVESLIAAHEKDGQFIDAPAYEVAAGLIANDGGLKAGELIGPYRILSLLGQGGMGEVYLAEDERLERKVALKILPAQFTADRDRLRRFEQEARAASALSHPNILTIYEVGQIDGKHFISTEFIEGLTLRERISGARLRISEALEIGVQIASALSAAHSAGIIHRDIKPENIMVRSDGYLKVLDFGLAKLSRQEKRAGAFSLVSTLVKTDSGMMMGTVTYMSPEQARGLAVDARTDIWSLGCVLYEMVMGRAPFDGQTTSDVIVSILEREPPLLTQQEWEVPEALEWIVTKALTKEREDRYQTAREVLTDLRRLKQRLDAAAELERSVAPASNPQMTLERNGREARLAPATSVVAQTEELRKARSTLSADFLGGAIKQHQRRTLWTLATLALVLFVAAFATYKFAGPFRITRETRTVSSERTGPLKISRVTIWPGVDAHPTISPDSNSIAYSSDHNGSFEIYVKQLMPGGREFQLTSDGEQNFEPTWSPDGKLIAYYSKKRGGIWVIPSLGGVAKQLVEFGSHPAWSHDGVMIAFQSDANHLGGSPVGSSTIWKVPSEGGKPVQLTKIGTPAGGHLSPVWSPDRKRITFVVHNFLATNVWSVSATGDDLKLVFQNSANDPVYAPDGQSIYYTAGTALWKMRVSPSSGEAVGERIFIADMGVSRLRHLAISADGKKLAYSMFAEASNILSIPLSVKSSEPTGPPVNLTNETGTRNMHPTFSPDGRQIAFTERHRGIDSGIWHMDADGKNRGHITVDPNFNLPSWFPDGERIMFISSRDGKRRIWSLRIKSRKAEPLIDIGRDIEYARISPDGKRIIFNLETNGITNTWVVPVEGGDPKQLTFDNELAGFSCWSPDGKFIAYQMKRGDDAYAMVMPSDGGTPTQLTFERGLSWPFSWSPDGDKIAFAGYRDGIWNVYWVSRTDKTQKQVTNYTKLSSYVRYPGWSPLGNQIVYEYAESTGNIWILELK
jgi:Tol biopolymer transport system component